jgi:hypothetical protein
MQRTSTIVAVGGALLATVLTTAVLLLPPTASNATTTAPAHTTVAANESVHTVTLTQAEHLTLTLHSTYWTIAGLHHTPVLTQNGPAVTHSTTSSSHCVPGQGCGYVVANYTPHSPGVVTITAHRTSCGEALLCPPSKRSYTLVVHVRAS